MQLADDSYEWYRTAAIRSRRMFRASEVLLLVLAAAIPVSGIVFSGNTTPAVVLGGLITVIGGIRGLFHWQENYVRFSRSRELVESERRLFRFRDGRYRVASDVERDLLLARAITQIERDELGEWSQLPNNVTSPTLDAEKTPPAG